MNKHSLHSCIVEFLSCLVDCFSFFQSIDIFEKEFHLWIRTLKHWSWHFPSTCFGPQNVTDNDLLRGCDWQILMNRCRWEMIGLHRGVHLCCLQLLVPWQPWLYWLVLLMCACLQNHTHYLPILDPVCPKLLRWCICGLVSPSHSLTNIVTMKLPRQVKCGTCQHTFQNL